MDSHSADTGRAAVDRSFDCSWSVLQTKRLPSGLVGQFASLLADDPLQHGRARDAVMRGDPVQQSPRISGQTERSVWGIAAHSAGFSSKRTQSRILSENPLIRVQPPETSSPGWYGATFTR